mgnify:CR=1 FL=1
MAKKSKILYSTLLFLYAAVAAVSFIFASFRTETINSKGELVGALLALSSLPYLLVFVVQDGFNNPKKSVYAAFGIIGVVLGITCFLLETTNTAVLDTVCLIRGIFDIVRLTIVLTDIIPMIFIEKKKLELVELGVSIGETIIAVFLIIEGFAGVRTHFFYMGCAFVILFAKCLIDRILEIKNEKQKASLDNN